MARYGSSSASTPPNRWISRVASSSAMSSTSSIVTIPTSLPRASITGSAVRSYFRKTSTADFRSSVTFKATNFPSMRSPTCVCMGASRMFLIRRSSCSVPSASTTYKTLSVSLSLPWVRTWSSTWRIVHPLRTAMKSGVISRPMLSGAYCSSETATERSAGESSARSRAVVLPGSSSSRAVRSSGAISLRIAAAFASSNVASKRSWPDRSMYSNVSAATRPSSAGGPAPAPVRPAQPRSPPGRPAASGSGPRPASPGRRRRAARGLRGGRVVRSWEMVRSLPGYRLGSTGRAGILPAFSEAFPTGPE